jgi:hypothetical protein
VDEQINLGYQEMGRAVNPLKTIRLCLFQGPLVEAVKKLPV